MPLPAGCSTSFMAFSFTLPELRAELRALGHDGLPDRLILTFLSQLNLPLPSASAHKANCSSDSSGYDTEASTCSTSCGNDIPKACSTRREYTDDGAGTRCAEHQPPLSDIRGIISKNSKTEIILPPAELCDGSLRVTACKPVEGGFRYVRGLSSAEPHLQSCHPPRSRAPMEQEETLSRVTDVENITENFINGIRFAESVDINVDKRHESVGHVRNWKRPDAVLTTGCGARSLPQQVKGKDRQITTDNMIEHYWISVGEEHMRAMHSKSSKEMEQQLGASVLEIHGIDGTSERKSGCGSLIEKVQQCEDELQCLTLSLQAQQCKKPWFLEAARKPKGFHDMEKLNVGGKNVLLSASDGTLATDPELMHAEGCETSSCPGQLCMVKPPNTKMILETHANVSEAPSSSLFDHVRECPEAACENLVTPEKSSQQQLDTKIDEADTLETTLSATFYVSEHDELEPAGQHENKENTMFCDLCPDQKGDPNPSVCSKSSSASYQHSTGYSGDSRSNVSQQMSTRSSSMKPSRSSSQQRKRRGGKIDRVARFAEMQRLWKKDTFLAANEAGGGKRKGVQNFHRLFSSR